MLGAASHLAISLPSVLTVPPSTEHENVGIPGRVRVKRLRD